MWFINLALNSGPHTFEYNFEESNRVYSCPEKMNTGKLSSPHWSTFCMGLNTSLELLTFECSLSAFIIIQPMLTLLGHSGKTCWFPQAKQWHSYVVTILNPSWKYHVTTTSLTVIQYRLGFRHPQSFDHVMCLLWLFLAQSFPCSELPV